ncbi:hypothetical protein ACIBG8_39140 [Nonomuraea sp. NPDC050556]|uniref:hypothetical protein n=1 Tax=Nonomuraea sp. NPDC050556 TaxID=3364369 RepID=UPI0037A6DEAB
MAGLVGERENNLAIMKAESGRKAAVIATEGQREAIPALSLRHDGPLVGVRLETLAVAPTAIHGRDIVHENLGPDTVLVTPGGVRLGAEVGVRSLGGLIMFGGTEDEVLSSARVLPPGPRSVVAAGEVLLGLLR